MTLVKLLLSTLVVAHVFIKVSCVSAFTSSSTHIQPIAPSTAFRDPNSLFVRTMQSTMRLRGGGAAAAGASDPAAKNKKVRLNSFDSSRFLLITTIVLGHFISFANPSSWLFKFFSQHNASVGAFCALSGYVTAYTSSENAQRAASPKLLSTPKQEWIVSKLFGYYPLHLIVLLLFSPMFIFTDVSYNGWLQTIWHGFLSVTMLQAWFPMHAEIWNAPTWYLSAQSFCTAVMAFALPSLSTMTKPQLRRTVGWIFLTYIIPKIGYCYDFNTWTLAEGITAPKAHPNLAVFNMHRFSPVFMVAEFLLGAAACRLVMLDNAVDEQGAPKTNALSTLVPLGSIIVGMALRASGLVTVSDLLFRALVFVPMYVRFLMGAHRNTVKGVKDPLLSILNSKFLVTLGNLGFPIFVVHGPIGQIFFKKIIATKVFGQVLTGPTNFAIYLATTMAAAWILQKTVLQSKVVADWSKKTSSSLSSWM